MTRGWLNGRMLDNADLRIDPADRGFTLGDGVFETVLLRDGDPAHLPRHLARLRHGAAVLGILIPAADTAIAAALADLADTGPEVARITLTRGPASRGVLPEAAGTPTLLIRLAPLGPMPEQVDVIICRTTRRNEHSPLSRIKSLNYLDSILARREAECEGAGDAILLNTAGAVAEATSANVVARIGGRLYTPPVADGALPGIARALLIEQGATERRLMPDDLRGATSVILVNSLGARRVTRIA